MAYNNYLPGVSLDCVIFGFHENELKVLLLKLKSLDKWALPGGFVELETDVDVAATNVLKERTGLENIFLQQFHLFGKVARNDPQYLADLREKEIIPPSSEEWFKQRFVSVGYYALVEYSKVRQPQPDFTSDICDWYSILELPQMVLDHQEILTKAYVALVEELRLRPIGLNLLPEEFTMPELHALYETILQKKLDRRNFRRKMLSNDILIDTEKRRTGAQNKAPIIYKFDLQKYEEAMQSGLKAAFF